MASSATTSPHTAPAADHRLGFTSLRSKVTVDDLPVSGRIPDWLHGSLLRNGPAEYEVGGIRLRHWFEGLAMLHRFTIAGGRVSYANRFLGSRARHHAERSGRLEFRQFATVPCRSLFARVTSVFFPRFGDNANINLGRLGDDFVALTETPMPVRFDPRTLEAAGVAYAPPGHHSTAHPHHDRTSGELIAYATRFGRRSSDQLYAQRDRARQRPIASLPVRTPAFMHRFGMSEYVPELV